MSIFNKLFISIMAVQVVLIMLITPIAIAAPTTTQELKNAACKGVSDSGTNCDDAAVDSTISNLISTIVDIFSWVIGVVAVIMVIYGGFKYVTAAGESSKVKSAKDTILYALIGLVIVGLAQVIVRFVIGQFL